MIKSKEAPPRLRGTSCPMRNEQRCMGQACAWWQDTSEREGWCAVLALAWEIGGGRDARQPPLDE